MTISRLLAGRDSAIVTCPSTARVEEAIALLAEKRIGALPVLNETGAVAGIFSERDVIHCLRKHGAGTFDLKVSDVMTAPAITVTPETPVLLALSVMTRRRVRHLPVIEGGAMVGFVSIGDLVKHRMDRIETEAEALRSYIQSA